LTAVRIPDLLLHKNAALAQQAGQQKLTGESLEQAEFNLAMGYANVMLAGADLVESYSQMWCMAEN
jgi:hypothetical protein